MILPKHCYNESSYVWRTRNKVIELLRTFPQGEASSIYLSYVTTSEEAKGLDTSVGFMETGHIEDVEMLARFKL